MGNCAPSRISPADEISVAASRRNREIERDMWDDYSKYRKIIKVLLLGNPDSGKSTILKQIKITHANGFSDEELLQKRNFIYGNTIRAMISLISGKSKLDLFYGCSDSAAHEAHLRGVLERNEQFQRFSEQTYSALQGLLNDKCVIEAMKRSGELRLPDYSIYFLESIERIYAQDYIPTVQDVLYSHESTMAMDHLNFVAWGSDWRIVDIGARQLPKKWMHHFEKFEILFFVADLSDYDRVTEEDIEVAEDVAKNRLRKSMQFFALVCSQECFRDTHMLLFLNKLDKFREKIQRIPLKKSFPEYEGSDNADEAVRFIEEQFMKAKDDVDPRKPNILYQQISATDQTEDVNDTICKIFTYYTICLTFKNPLE